MHFIDMSRKHSYIYIFAILASMAICGCKPTEKNYRQAYETAQNARQSAREADEDLGIPQLQSINGPRKQRVGEDSVYIKREALLLNGEAPKSGVKAANVAVGKYKMTANALSDAEALRKDGFDAFVMANSNGEFYTVAGSADSLEDAVKLMKLFRNKYKNRPYIGLPAEPIIIIPYGSRI